MKDKHGSGNLKNRQQCKKNGDRKEILKEPNENTWPRKK
jgi:hypothetical protein